MKRSDGSWLVDGLLPIDELKELMNVNSLVDESDFGYQTLGGFMMAQLGSIPKTGQQIQFMEYSFEIVDMDGRRVDKVLITSLAIPETGQEDSSAANRKNFKQNQESPINEEGKAV